MKKTNIILLFLMALAWTSCHKDKEVNVKEAVVSNEEVTVSETQAHFSWRVDFVGEFHTGVELSQNENMTGLKRVEATRQEGEFVAVVDSLTVETKYYYRIVVWNKFRCFEQPVGDFMTLETSPTPGQDTIYYDITLSVNLLEGGTAMGGGSFAEGDTCTLTATANEGYVFVNWTENDIPVDTNSVYFFVVTGDRDLVANFREEDAVLYTVITKADPPAGGEVTGGGQYEQGREIELKATANPGYTFIHWDDGSTDNPRRVTVTADITYTAYFNHDEYEIEVLCQPENGGTATGGGRFHYGDTITLSATPNANFTFAGWSDGNTDNPRTITVNADMEFTAFFKKITYTVTVQAGTGGTAYIGDMIGTIEATFEHGENCTVHAIPETSYSFVNWTEYGIEASTAEDYNFEVTGNCTLVANFTYNGGGNAPQGAIDGKFTINSSGDQVYFSQGNLQYIGSASTPYWKFADHQWVYLGTTTNQNSTNQKVDRDLFGWGTSGYNHGAMCYQPWSTSQTNSDYYAYGQYTYNLYDQDGCADWGYNAISNGGGQENSGWRTLTGGSNGEWNYIFNKRNASTVNSIPNARYAKAKVNNVQGVILFPDTYTHPSGVVQPIGINETGNTGWNGNNYSAADFESMEDNGAVFLPVAGSRGGTSVYYVGGSGYYWSASYNNSSNAFSVNFGGSGLNPQSNYIRYGGLSVRLVRSAQ